MFDFSTLWVNFGAFWLVTDRPVLSADTGAVGMAGEKPLAQLVYKATVIHTAFPSIVIKDQVVLGIGCLVPFIRGVVFLAEGRWGDHARNQQQKQAGLLNVKSHPSPQLLPGVALSDAHGGSHGETGGAGLGRD